jgi:caffeoyl-CoA O-methyltransferase
MTVYDDRISSYITGLFAAEDPELSAIRAGAVEQGLPDIGISPEEGRFLAFLVQTCQARLVIEIGTLAGYSAAWMARALPAGVRLISLEKSARHAAVARANMVRLNLDDRVEIRQGEAQQLMDRLDSLAPFDMVFIDAEKSGYPAYYAWALRNLRPGGLVAAHNALWGGAVVGEYSGEAIDQMKSFNRLVAADPQVTSTIFPAGDGTLVAVKLG